jgi:hypothetical protein
MPAAHPNPRCFMIVYLLAFTESFNPIHVNTARICLQQTTILPSKYKVSTVSTGYCPFNSDTHRMARMVWHWIAQFPQFPPGGAARVVSATATSAACLLPAIHETETNRSISIHQLIMDRNVWYNMVVVMEPRKMVCTKMVEKYVIMVWGYNNGYQW